MGLKHACDTDPNEDCHYDPMCGCDAPYADLSSVGKALADGKIGGGQNRDAVRDAAAPAICDRANDAIYDRKIVNTNMAKP